MEYDGASPYPRCRDARLEGVSDDKSVLLRGGVLEVSGELVPMHADELRFAVAGPDRWLWGDARPGTSVDSEDSGLHPPHRLVSGNRFYVTRWQDDDGDWHGVSLDINAELVTNNEVCVAPNADAPATELRLGAPVLPARTTGNSWRSFLHHDEGDCDPVNAWMPSRDDAHPDLDEYWGGDQLAWAFCECDGGHGCPAQTYGTEEEAGEQCEWRVEPEGERIAVPDLFCSWLDVAPDDWYFAERNYTNIAVNQDGVSCWMDLEALEARLDEAEFFAGVERLTEARVDAIYGGDAPAESILGAHRHWFFPDDRFMLSTDAADQVDVAVEPSCLLLPRDFGPGDPDFVDPCRLCGPDENTAEDGCL